MTGRVSVRTSRRRTLAALAVLAAALTLACGTGYLEIPIETPIQPKMDVSPFQRVLVAGFISGGNDEVDANQETVRLLRSQLRNKSQLKVIDADIIPLLDIAQQQTRNQGAAAPETSVAAAGSGAAAAADSPIDAMPLPKEIKDEKDLEAYERLFANTAYWKRIGEEYQSPLIVTGTVLFMPHARSGFVQREVEQYDNFGRRRVVPVRSYMERKGFVLRPKFVFIDGRSGATIYSESYREEILYSAQQSIPALSSYFELMDRLLPNFLSALSSQKVRGTRVLIK
ncbi:MAG: hypothetical protein IT176_10015 [Acidobacteria bacterium]|nr:hypothetical protein [Acidobacteriota bacterium]